MCEGGHIISSNSGENGDMSLIYFDPKRDESLMALGGKERGDSMSTVSATGVLKASWLQRSD